MDINEDKDIIVLCPNEIESLDELVRILAYIDTYALGEETGVVLLQNFQLGGLYLIRTKEEYEAYKPEAGRTEFYARFWPRSYFEELKVKYK